jgi:hypothetical protein
MIEALCEILGELLLQLFGEFLFELGFRSFAEPFREQPNPWLAGFGYSLFGGCVGAISLLIFPAHFVAGGFRIANLMITPVAAGACMAALGAWRAKRVQRVLRLDRFAYGYLFALAFALIRFWFARCGWRRFPWARRARPLRSTNLG